MNPHHILRLVLASVLLRPSSATWFSQGASLPQKDVITIEGTVRNSAGEPVAGATVVLDEKGHPTRVETKTKADGRFAFSPGRSGTYTVTAEKRGFRDDVADSLVLAVGKKKHVDLVLEPVGPAPSGAAQSSRSSPETMEFKDEPHFTVAGVTDWSTAGLHGSDTRARTSETLAQDTLALKSGGPEENAAGGPAGTAIGRETSASIAYKQALAYQASGDFVRAREQVRKTLAITDSPEGHRLLGDLDERLGDPLGAVHEFERAARLDPSEQNYFEWGAELLLHRAAQPAAEVFAKGSRAHPGSARLLAGLGAALYAGGSYEEAALRLCAASDMKPADPAPYLFLGKMEKASPAPLSCSEEKLRRFVEEQPENALANYYYAMALWKRERGSENPAALPQAEALLEKAASLDPKLGEAYVQVGILYSARGAVDQAIQAYQKAIAVAPDLSEAHYRLSQAYKRIGEEAKAHREFQAYQQAEKTEAAAMERQRRELRQFLIILKDQPVGPAPH
jgi:tetratricopeptide (TPR) repeat protein